MKWRTLPMPRLLLPMVLGIVVADGIRLSRQDFQELYHIGLAALVVLILALAFRPDFRERAWFGILVFMVISGLGFFRMEQSQQWKRPVHFAWQRVGDSSSVWGKVLETRPGPNSYRLMLQVQAKAPIGKKQWEKVSGKLLVYLKIEDKQIPPQIGQFVYLSGVIDAIKAPLNPDAFDYKAYLERKGIHHQLFAPSSAWKVDAAHQERFFTLSLQAFCLKVLEKHLPAGDTYAVGAALIMGERSTLSQEIQKAYSNSGAVHVLSVSGLHVGVLAIVLRFVFGFFATHKYARKLGLGLELGSIWLFALLTGAAPATLRAAVMFSMIIGARAVVRQYNIWNILAASAFALLCWQPNLLWDIGFQLSYLAIAGIVAFQPWIYQRWLPPNLLWDYLWKMTTVGLAAQLSTGPLSIHYFHQFPIFFWLSGLVAVPLSGVILMLGLGLFLLEGLDIPAEWLGQLLAWSVQLLNASIVFIQELPKAVIIGFWWSALAALGMYGILLFVCIAVQRRKLGWLNLALLLFFGWICTQWPGIFRAQQQQRLVCYHVPKASVLDLMQGQTLLSLSNADTLPELMAVQNHRFHQQIKSVQEFDWQANFQWGNAARQGECLFFGQNKIGIVDGGKGFPTKTCTLLLIRNNPRVYPENLQPKPRLLIIDGSNHNGTRRWVKKLAKELNISVHDTAEQGAWILNL